MAPLLTTVPTEGHPVLQLSFPAVISVSYRKSTEPFPWWQGSHPTSPASVVFPFLTKISTFLSILYAATASEHYLQHRRADVTRRNSRTTSVLRRAHNLQPLLHCLLNLENVHPDSLHPGVILDLGHLIQEMLQLSVLVPSAISGVWWKESQFEEFIPLHSCQI